MKKFIFAIFRAIFQTMQKLDGARLMTYDQMIPVRQRSCHCGGAIGCCGIWWFLAQSPSCRIGRNGLHGEGMLHRRTGALARVYLHFCCERGVH